MEDLKKVLDRIKALLRMADDVSSPNEASIAAARARKLMDEYQIGVHDLKEPNVFREARVDKAYQFLPLWKNWLAVSVAKYNDCKCVLVPVDLGSTVVRKQIAFKGYASDVTVASGMYSYLVATVESLCSKYILGLGYTKYVASVGDSYKKGCSDTLVARLTELLEARQAGLKTAAGTSLVVIKMADVEREFGKADYKSAFVRSPEEQAAAHAQNAGARDARNISLDRQINSEDRRKLRG